MRLASHTVCHRGVGDVHAVGSGAALSVHPRHLGLSTSATHAPWLWATVGGGLEESPPAQGRAGGVLALSFLLGQ